MSLGIFVASRECRLADKFSEDFFFILTVSAAVVVGIGTNVAIKNMSMATCNLELSRRRFAHRRRGKSMNIKNPSGAES